jgi:hypothetical protein
MTSKVEESSHIINVRVFTFLQMLAKLIILRCYKFFDESQIIWFFSEISQNNSCLCKTHERRKPHEWHSLNAISLDFRLECVILDFRIFELCCEFFWAVNVLTSFKLFVEKNCMRSHKTTLPGGKHGKSEIASKCTNIDKYLPISDVYVWFEMFDFCVFLKIILGCQCFEKSLNVRRIWQISLDLDLNVWF